MSKDSAKKAKSVSLSDLNRITRSYTPAIQREVRTLTQIEMPKIFGDKTVWSSIHLTTNEHRILFDEVLASADHLEGGNMNDLPYPKGNVLLNNPEKYSDLWKDQIESFIKDQHLDAEVIKTVIAETGKWGGMGVRGLRIKADSVDALVKIGVKAQELITPLIKVARSDERKKQKLQLAEEKREGGAEIGWLSRDNRKVTVLLLKDIPSQAIGSWLLKADDGTKCVITKMKDGSWVDTYPEGKPNSLGKLLEEFKAGKYDFSLTKDYREAIFKKWK